MPEDNMILMDQPITTAQDDQLVDLFCGAGGSGDGRCRPGNIITNKGGRYE